MAEKETHQVVAADKSNVRWRYILLALVLGAIAFLIVPVNTQGSVPKCLM